MPLLLVTAVAVADPANWALAPLPGAVNVTETPFTGLLKESFTITCKAAGKAVLTNVLCGVPALTVTLAAAPAVLVRLKLAVVATPITLAVTV